MSYNINSQNINELFNHTKQAKNKGSHDYQVDPRFNTITYENIEIERKVNKLYNDFHFYVYQNNKKTKVMSVSTLQTKSVPVSDLAYGQKLFKLLRKIHRDNVSLLSQSHLFL